MAKIKRSIYADMFGPTVGDRVRLADTDLIIEVEKDFTTYGEEVKFGGGKVIRDGMGQSQITNKQGAADTVITNALIVDHWGIVKADVAIKDGRSARPWTDNEDLAWVDPFRPEVWEYNIDLAREAALKGFDEVQFDAVRFEPGQTRDVQLVALVGKRVIYGFRGDVQGKL